MASLPRLSGVNDMRAAFGTRGWFVVQDATGPTPDEIPLTGGVFDVTEAGRSDLLSQVDAKDDEAHAVDGFVAANDTQTTLTIGAASTAIKTVLAWSPSTTAVGEPMGAFSEIEDLRRSQRAFAEQRTPRFGGS
jgi:hypothetical protein